MIFNIATTDSSLSLQRRADLIPLLNAQGMVYKFYPGAITALKYDGLYLTAKEIIRAHINDNYVIFAEDDLVLTNEFSPAYLKTCIDQASILKLDVLATGAWLSYEEVPVAENLLKIGGFRGTQLTVIFKSAYQALLDAPVYNHFEDTISKYQPKLQIGLTFPFLSKQREDIPSMIVEKNHNYLFHENEDKISISLGLKNQSRIKKRHLSF